jgi:hypothetical protein
MEIFLHLRQLIVPHIQPAECQVILVFGKKDPPHEHANETEI